MKFFRYSFFYFLFFTFLFCIKANATHYRAGEVLYELIGNYSYRVTVITYTKYDGPSVGADEDTVDIDWGDGHQDVLWRTNGPDVQPANGVPDGEIIATVPINIKKNLYVGTHTYSGPPGNSGFYLISFTDPNRIGGILNMDNSVYTPFCVMDTLYYPTDISNIGFNSSPVLLHPPIDYANVNDTFYHNPLAIDYDGDSLDFQLVPCLKDVNDVVDSYSYPDQYCRAGGHSPNTLTIDKHTGEIVWATPCVQGIFNIAILIREYRAGILIGTLMRDMQIVVEYEPNHPPQISAVNDTCIRAGDALNVSLTARDPDAQQIVTLTADGLPFYVSNPATFVSTPNVSPVFGTFHWTTDCDNIRGQPYMVLFDASDNYVGGPLVYLETWQIRVIAPPPLNLTAVASHQSVTLHWQNPYVCASDSDFRGFSVWRKIGCDPFTPDYCETGLAGRGYTKLTTNNIFTYTYTDNTAVVGQQYSYRVVAHFSKLSPNGNFQFDPTESVASNEACVFMPIDVPVILNVDVQQTDVVNGKIFVRWSKPLAGGTNLDTIQNPPPYRFDLYRSHGFDFDSGNPALIYSTPAASSYSTLIDTTFVDTNIDTKDSAWNYKLLFYSNDDTVGPSAPASSVYLNVHSSDQSLYLSWNENVPWTNDSFSIYRLNKISSLFEPIDTVYSHNYTDVGLINDSTYCYYVQAYGHYTVGVFPSPLLNKSEEDCGVPIDTTAPCAPALNARNDCDQYNGEPWNAAQFINYLSWSNANDSCSGDVTHYYIFFGSDSSHLAFLDSVSSRNDTTYNHVLTESLAGCYAVTALDRVGNQSAKSNIFCVDNCPYYVLPNTFTPNGDGQNDLFHPYHPYRFVPKIDMEIFNRWGDKVFETHDPEINWDGRDLAGKELSDGVYLYAGFYYEQHQSGLVKKPLSGEKKGGGFIHLIRGK